MGPPAAKQGDRIAGTDMHEVMVPPPGPSPVLLPHPFAGVIDGGLSLDVTIMGQPAATVGSTARNLPPHIPQGGTFPGPPANQATIQFGSASVMINGKPAARTGDTALTCNDPADLPAGTVVATGTVLIG
jgi:uncharacterized Zn-binding protein involved in type VI secretion